MKPADPTNRDGLVDNEEPDLFRQGAPDNEFGGFSEKSIRLAFVRKVYSILVVQLCVTMAFISAFLYIEPLQRYSANNQWLWIVAFLATIICIVVLSCCPHVRRSFPSNFIFLGVFTLCESFLLGGVASHYEQEDVLIAIGITTIVFFALTAFAMQTKWDFTMCSGALCVILVVLLCFGVLCMFMQSRILSILYSAIGAIVFSMYLVFDTQLMLGGSHAYALSPEEYIFAALNLYLDIINMFLFILRLVGAVRN